MVKALSLRQNNQPIKVRYKILTQNRYDKIGLLDLDTGIQKLIPAKDLSKDKKLLERLHPKDAFLIGFILGQQ